MTHCFGSFCKASSPWCPCATLGTPKPKMTVKTAAHSLLQYVDTPTLHLRIQRVSSVHCASNTIQGLFCNKVFRYPARPAKGDRINNRLVDCTPRLPY